MTAWCGCRSGTVRCVTVELELGVNTVSDSKRSHLRVNTPLRKQAQRDRVAGTATQQLQLYCISFELARSAPYVVGDVQAAMCRTQRNFGPKTIQALKKRAGWGGKKKIYTCVAGGWVPTAATSHNKGGARRPRVTLTQEAKSNPTFGAHAAAPLLSDWNRDDSPKIIVATLKEFDTGWKGRTGARQPPTHLGT